MSELFDCPLEAQVLASVQNGQWTQELEHHRTHCEVCSAAWLLATVLREDRELLGSPPAPASLLWWKARLHEHLRAWRSAAIFAGWARAAMIVAAAVVGNLLLIVLLARVLNKTVEGGSVAAFALAGLETAIAIFGVISHTRTPALSRPADR